MTKGNLGVIVCPILEDELVYNLANDNEEKNIFLLESDNSIEISEKMTSKGIKHTIFDERMFLNGMEPVPEDSYNIIILMKEMSLHSEPEILKENLRDTLRFMQSKVDAFALYYGLCGNANKGIEEWAKENLEVPVAIFKDRCGNTCDDCIGVAVGGTDRYYELQKKHTGVLYYTPAMATKWRDFFGNEEMFKGGDTKDYSRLKLILDMCDYHDVMIIPTGLGDKDAFLAAVDDFSREFDFNILQLEDGWVTLDPTIKLHEDSKSLLKERQDA